MSMHSKRKSGKGASPIIPENKSQQRGNNKGGPSRNNSFKNRYQDCPLECRFTYAAATAPED